MMHMCVWVCIIIHFFVIIKIGKYVSVVSDCKPASKEMSIRFSKFKMLPKGFDETADEQLAKFCSIDYIVL